VASSVVFRFSILRICGVTLARAHAKASLNCGMGISHYLGTDTLFERVMTDFAVRYADINERNYEKFLREVQSAQITAVTGV
jgi:hypothetical protein